MVNSTCLQLTPPRIASRITTPTPAKPSRPGNASSHEGGTPRERSAPRVMSPEMPAAGSRMAMRIRSKRGNINGLAPVQPPGSGVEQHHLIVPLDGATRLELQQPGEGGAAFRTGVDPLERLQVPAGGGQLHITHRYGAAAALPQRAQHEAITQRSGDAEPRRDRPRLGPGRAALRARRE